MSRRAASPGCFPEPEGVKVLDQVGSVEAARRSAHAGVDVVIAQGVEAGGHVAGEVATMALLPRVVDAVAGHRPAHSPHATPVRISENRVTFPPARSRTA